MSDINFSYLKRKDALTMIKVLDFKDLDTDNFRRTGKLGTGEITFSIPSMNFDMDGSNYEILHNDKIFRFHPKKRVFDLRMKLVVSGLIDDQF